MKLKVINIRRGKNEKSIYLYGDLYDGDELICSATLTYIYSRIEKLTSNNPKENLVMLTPKYDEIYQQGMEWLNSLT